jgi:hypothetical protein
MGNSLIGSGHIALAHISSRDIGQAAHCEAPDRDGVICDDAELPKTLGHSSALPLSHALCDEGAEAAFYHLDAEIRLERLEPGGRPA